MSNADVTILDYGLGNLFSITNAFKYLGARVQIASRNENLNNATRVVIPGVGAFSDGMHEMKRRGFVESLHHVMQKKRPILGICLGMQMLLSMSEEFGEHEGLGIIPGKVVAIPGKTTDGKLLKIPHIGWARVFPRDQEGWSGPLTQSIRPGTSFYFVHSYVARPEDEDQLIGYCEYGGHQLTAIISRENVFGVQFHPEKSAGAGLRLLKNFLSINPNYAIGEFAQDARREG